jgi:hypothetical protein
MRSDHKRMRREEVYRNDNFPTGRASRWRTAALPPCGIDGLRSALGLPHRAEGAHPIKRTQRQQGLMAHQQQRRWCQRHPSDRRSSWVITMLKCDGPVWTESGEIRAEAIASRLYTVGWSCAPSGTPRTAFDQAARCRPRIRRASFRRRRNTAAADTTSGQRRFLSAAPFPY